MSRGMEVLIGVYWQRFTYEDRRALDGHERNMMRNRKTASLALDYDPQFTEEEMSRILFAAKMEAAEMLRLRKRGSR